jgi:hypothetical protein
MMKASRLTALLLFLALTTEAAIERHSWGIQGPQRAFRGSSIWIMVTSRFFHAYPASFDTANGRVIAEGNDFAVGEAVFFFPENGSVLPSTLDSSLSYSVCEKSDDSVRVALRLVGTCGEHVRVKFVDKGTGTIKVGKITNDAVDHVFLQSPVLPAGVTIGAVLCNGAVPCFQTNGVPWAYGGGQLYWVRLDVSNNAALGPGKVQFTFRCKEGRCPESNITAPLTIQNLTPLPVNHPTSFPAIPDKSVWESKMLTLAAKWCPNKSAGAINPSPFPAKSGLSFGSAGENQIWYYDGAWAYYQIADYTNDEGWSRCGDTIANFYREAILAVDGRFSTYHRWFTDGLRRSSINSDQKGKLAIERVWDNNGTSIVSGSLTDAGMRETAYALETAIAAARVRGATRFSGIADAAMKARVQRTADQLLGLLMVYTDDNYTYFQSFMAGLGMRAAIEWYEFSEDKRVPVIVKGLVDMMNAEMWNKNPSFPNEMSWMRGAAVPGAGAGGPRCAYNCFPYPSAELHMLFVPAWAWLWWMTGDPTYQTIGDAMWKAALKRDIGYSGKIFSQSFRWSFDYVAWREGKKPDRP